MPQLNTNDNSHDVQVQVQVQTDSKPKAKPAVKANTYKPLYIYSMVISQTLGNMLLYIMSCFNPIQNFVKYHAFSETVPKIQLTLMTSFLPLGAALGAITSGKIATLGRKKPMLAMDAFAILGTVLTLLPNPISLLIGRLIQGYCAGVNSGLVPLYIREVSPTEISGRLGTFNQLNLSIAQLLPNLIGLVMPLGKGDSDPNNKIYMVILGLAGVFPLLRLIFTLLIFNHETPKYLLSINKEVETKALLKKFYTEDRAEAEFNALKVQKEDQSHVKKVGLREIFSARYRKRLLVGVIVAMGQRIVGLNAMTFYANDIFSVGSAKGTRIPQNYTAILFSLAVIGAFFAGTMIEKLGRKFLLVAGAAFCGVSIGAFGILSIIDDSSPAAKWLLWAYMLGYGLTIGPISWIYVSDILPEIGIAISILCLWLVVFFIGLIFPYLPDGGMGYAFIFFSVCSLLCMVFNIFFVKETKGKTKAEIDSMFGYKEQNKTNNDIEKGQDTKESASLKRVSQTSYKSSNSDGEVEQAKDLPVTPASVDNKHVDININA